MDSEVTKSILLVLSYFGGGGVIVLALSSWLGKVWANRILESDRSRYNQELETIRAGLARAKEEYIEAYKSQLALASHERQLRFSKLHEKRFEILADIYARLDTAITEGQVFGTFLDLAQAKGYSWDELLADQARVVAKASEEFSTYFLGKKLYLSETLAGRIEDTAHPFRELSSKYTLYSHIYRDKPEIFAQEIKAQLAEFGEESKKADTVLHAIEQEFRAILGVGTQ